MSVVNITDIGVLNNPGRFTDPYVFKITFECISELSEGRSPAKSKEEAR
jgi:histone chaperone ASF1